LVPRPSSNRLNIEKVYCYETSAGVVPERFQGLKMASKTVQDPPKTGPRSSWVGFFDCLFFASIFHCFGMDFWVVLASQMEPPGMPRTRQIGPGGVQDGPKIVLVRSCFRLVVRDRFFDRLGLLLGSFLGVLGLFLGHLGVSWARFGSSWARFGALRMA
jgi:hypothetical protein